MQSVHFFTVGGMCEVLPLCLLIGCFTSLLAVVGVRVRRLRDTSTLREEEQCEASESKRNININHKVQMELNS